MRGYWFLLLTLETFSATRRPPLHHCIICENLFPASSITVQVICIQPEIICLPPSHPTHRFFHRERYISLIRQGWGIEPHTDNSPSSEFGSPYIPKTYSWIYSTFEFYPNRATTWSTLTTHFLHASLRDFSPSLIPDTHLIPITSAVYVWTLRLTCVFSWSHTTSKLCRWLGGENQRI